MVSIKTISCDRESAAARACRFSFYDNVTEDFIVSIDPIEFSYAVRTTEGKLLENYRGLQESVRSEFFPVFLTLEKTLRAAMNYNGDSIFHHMESSRIILDRRDGISSAVNVFRCEGEEYAAAVIWNMQEEIPDFTYAVFKGEELIEEYKALYRAIDSYYYPVFAELDSELDGKGAENKTQETERKNSVSEQEDGGNNE